MVKGASCCKLGMLCHAVGRIVSITMRIKARSSKSRVMYVAMASRLSRSCHLSSGSTAAVLQIIRTPLRPPMTLLSVCRSPRSGLSGTTTRSHFLRALLLSSVSSGRSRSRTERRITTSLCLAISLSRSAQAPRQSRVCGLPASQLQRKSHVRLSPASREPQGLSTTLANNDCSFTSPIRTVSNAPLSDESDSHLSGDFNPIHVNPYSAHDVDFPGTITHGRWTSAATRRYILIFKVLDMLFSMRTKSRKRKIPMTAKPTRPSRRIRIPAVRSSGSSTSSLNDERGSSATIITIMIMMVTMIAAVRNLCTQMISLLRR
jgi:hypothetical protein